MDADEALLRAWNLGMDEAGWTDAVTEEAGTLLPTLLAAGYAALDDAAWTWWFTEKAIVRAKELEESSAETAES
jgi:hypothetical protein